MTSVANEGTTAISYTEGALCNGCLQAAVHLNRYAQYYTEELQKFYYGLT